MSVEPMKMKVMEAKMNKPSRNEVLNKVDDTMAKLENELRAMIEKEKQEKPKAVEEKVEKPKAVEEKVEKPKAVEKKSSDDLFKSDVKPDTEEDKKKRTDELIKHELHKKEMREKKGTSEKPPSMNKLSASVRKAVKERLAQDYETHEYRLVGLAHPIQDIIDHIATLQRAETYWGKNYEAVKKYLKEVVEYVRDASIPFPKSDTSNIEIITNDDLEKIFKG